MTNDSSSGTQRDRKRVRYHYLVNGDECSIKRRQDASEVGADTLLAKAGFRHTRFDLYLADPAVDPDDEVTDETRHYRGERPIGEPLETADLREHTRFVVVSKNERKQRQRQRQKHS